MALAKREIIDKQITVKIFNVKKHWFKKDEIEKIKDISLVLDSIPNKGDWFSVIHGKLWNMNKINKIKDESKTLYKVINKEFVFNEPMNDYYINLYVKEDND